MIIDRAPIPEILLIEPDVFEDARGFFMEIWNDRKYDTAGLPERFVQDNLSRSSHGVLRGLHYQHPNGQGKLIQVLEGEVLDVAVDIRQGSPTFGAHFAKKISAKLRNQVFVPAGFAHGFSVLSETVLFVYKCTRHYDPTSEGHLRWDDPDLGIDWLLDAPHLSAKDAAAPRLAEIPTDQLPTYES